MAAELNTSRVKIFLDKGVASVGALDEGEGVGFASLDTSTVTIDEVERVVGCECRVCVLVDIEVVACWWITRAIGKEVVERVDTFWTICVSSHQWAMQSTRDLREHVNEVDHATDTCAYFIEF